MADGVNHQAQIVSAGDEHAAGATLTPAVGVGERPRGGAGVSSPHSHKFLVATAMLIGVGIAAVTLAVILLANGSRASAGTRWSDWSPPDSGTQAASEIANFLAPHYRISGVDQLDLVTVVNINNSSTAATSTTGSTTTSNGLQVAVRTSSNSSQVQLLSGNTIAYNLCGIGSSNCAITTGQASADRLLLLRREAMELALYTFKYIGGTQNVVAILPPGHVQPESRLTAKPPTSNSASGAAKPINLALLFERQELQPFLSQPLSKTLTFKYPPLVSELSIWRNTVEAALVAQVTANGVFADRIVQAQDGSNLIVLDQLPPQ